MKTIPLIKGTILSEMLSIPIEETLFEIEVMMEFIATLASFSVFVIEPDAEPDVYAFFVVNLEVGSRVEVLVDVKP